MMIPIKLHEWENEALQPYIERYAGVIGLGKLSAGSLVDKINAIPDTASEKALLVHYWNGLCLALSQQNDQAIAGWLTALALATHTASFLLPKAASRVKSTKALNSRRSAGTASTKKKAAARDKKIRRIVEQAFKKSPSVKPKQFGHLADKLRIAESTLVKKAGEILKELREA